MTIPTPVTRSDQLPHDGTWPPAAGLVTAAASDDRVAMERLLTATYPKVAGFFKARGCTRDEASELASETLTRIVEHLPGLRNPDAYRTWCWRLTDTVFRDWLRSNSRFSGVRTLFTASYQSTPDDEYEHDEEEQRIGHAFAALNEADQTLLWMRHVEELSYADIARIRGGTEGAARVATHRANRRLAELFERLS